MRESHRPGHSVVKLPLEDRSLKLMPETARWMNKRDLNSKEWYAEIMARHRKPE